MGRGALDAAWPWLKAIRDDERRSLHLLWSEDVTVLRKRVPALVAFLSRLGAANDAETRGQTLAASLASGRFEVLQAAARLYTAHGKDAERKWRGDLEKDIDAMRKEASGLVAVLKKFPEPNRLDVRETA
ncbi:MAG: hypothetical protein WC985_08960 [Thermoplasmata archaeon]